MKINLMIEDEENNIHEKDLDCFLNILKNKILKQKIKPKQSFLSFKNEVGRYLYMNVAYEMMCIEKMNYFMNKLDKCYKNKYPFIDLTDWKIELKSYLQSNKK